MAKVAGGSAVRGSAAGAVAAQGSAAGAVAAQGSAAGAVAARDWAARAAAAPGSPVEASNGSAVYIQGLRPAQRRHLTVLKCSGWTP
jgi:hypothetical protein